jgi:hypothetical protein
VAELRVKGEEIHLTLEEAVELALSRNLNLRTQRYAREQARLGIEEATGIYDFNLLAALSTSSVENPAASNLDGADVQKQDRSTSRSAARSSFRPAASSASASRTAATRPTRGSRCSTRRSTAASTSLTPSR